MQAEVTEAAGAVPGVRWSICARTPRGEVLAAHEPDAVLPAASLGKLLLLLETARRLELDPHLADMTLSRRKVDPVGAAGLWQHLRTDDLPLADVALLVAACSDNLATNVLLQFAGLEAVGRLTGELGLTSTALLDAVRSERGPDADPPHLSIASAAELSALMARMAARTLVSAAASEQLEEWLAAGVDTSLVAAAFGVDPLTHTAPDRGLLLRHKTGGDLGTKGEAGTLAGPAGTVAYAVLARWDPRRDAELRDPVRAAMRSVGDGLRRHVTMAGWPTAPGSPT